jgi:hypothetical protein
MSTVVTPKTHYLNCHTRLGVGQSLMPLVSDPSKMAPDKKVTALRAEISLINPSRSSSPITMWEAPTLRRFPLSGSAHGIGRESHRRALLVNKYGELASWPSVKRRSGHGPWLTIFAPILMSFSFRPFRRNPAEPGC